ncbi:MAG: DUF5906 domain-containing protein [Euryarchaeota archaeon]|nr:DUF5906 domain-containing protein [Euryarchaeota archaeon]
MAQVTRTEAVKNFLLKVTRPDLAELYNYNMECQVNVAQDEGERIQGEFKGKRWHGWTDGLTTWKSFRVPWNAATEPAYDDKVIKWDIAKHAEGIGMTGWDWVEKVSRWVAFDFDSMVGHKIGLTHAQLGEIEKQAADIEWITVRRSTSGNGIHFYVFLDPPIETVNHNEHAALARAILGQLAAQTGYDFVNKVDICGGNMWVWHRKMAGTDGLNLIKQGEPLRDVSRNWRNHVKVITGRRRKNLPQEIEQQGNVTDIDRMFTELTGKYVKESLDLDHKKLIAFFRENNCLWWWDQDNNMLVTHTFHLKEAYEALNLKGIFTTAATGKERGNDHNCFLYPLRRGGWVARRFTPGVKETDSWDQDGGGWTRCYFNIEPDLPTAARSHEGIEHPSGGYVFREAENAQAAALKLGVDLGLPNFAGSRPAKLKEHKDGRLVVEINRESTDNPERFRGYLEDGKTWKKIYGAQIAPPADSENKSYDDIVRHLVSEQHRDAGWVMRADGRWIEEPLVHIKMALRSLNIATKDLSAILGSSVFRRWTLVNKPFQPEYPGDREWNRDACQLVFNPSKGDELHYPTWAKILNHVGESLTPELDKHPWAVSNGIITGADYLKCWIASLFQKPEEHLPYLYLWGPEASGKSMFHEALSLLITHTGYQRAENALISQSGFNGELRNAIICVVEEVNLSKKTDTAYKRIKDWVTAIFLPVHVKNMTPYLSTNTTHWVQCSNDQDSCPIFSGDTRIMVLFVDAIPSEQWENKRTLVQKLRKEAPDFLGEIMKLEIPESPDRLGVPILSTSAKEEIQKRNRNPLERYIDDCCYHVPGAIVTFDEFYNRFAKSVDATDIGYWTKIRVGKNIPKPYTKGRCGSEGAMSIGNISFQEGPKDGTDFVTVDNKLVPKGVS